MELQIVIKGGSTAELLKGLKAASAELGNVGEVIQSTPSPTTKKKAAKPAAVVEEVAEEIESFGEETTDADELGFGEEAEEPAAAAPAKKAPKLTEKDVNEACKAHARKHGRAETLKVLKGKFNAESIVEIKPELYAKVLAALKV